jgi:hypothetical protein
MVRAFQTPGKNSSPEWHGAASGHNPNRAARVSKRMFDSRAGELSIDLRRSVIWNYRGKNSNIRLLTRAALLFGRSPKSCQKNTKFERSTTNGRAEFVGGMKYGERCKAYAFARILFLLLTYKFVPFRQEKQKINAER